MTKKWLLVGVAILFCGSAYAQPMRTVLTKEHRLPRLYQVEVGADFFYQEMEMGEQVSTIPYLRYTLFRDLAVFGKLPYHRIDPDIGSSESGLGDASIGFEFVPYKNLFGYPWIMPHAEIIFDNGDEDKGLGTGEVEYMVGVALGTTQNRVLHYALDARYLILDDQDNIPSVAASLIWDLDAKFSLMAEIELSREKGRDQFGQSDSTHPLVFMVGMAYQATPSLYFMLNGGTTKHSDVEEIVRAKVAYTF